MVTKSKFHRGNKDVGMGLSMTLLVFEGVVVILVPFLFHDVTSLHHPSFQRNDFSTCMEPGRCFTAANCTGEEVAAADQRDCCVGTNDGLSYNNGSTCNRCIGMLVKMCSN